MVPHHHGRITTVEVLGNQRLRYAVHARLEVHRGLRADPAEYGYALHVLPPGSMPGATLHPSGIPCRPPASSRTIRSGAAPRGLSVVYALVAGRRARVGLAARGRPYSGTRPVVVNAVVA